MNETTSDKKNSSPEKASTAAPAMLTRIPVSQIFWAENIDLPGGHGQVSTTKCGPPEHDHQRYFLCDFIPAMQVLELTYIAGKDAVPLVSKIPMAHVRRFV